MIKEAIDQLRRLNPRPGARFAATNSQYVVPDLVVEANEHGDYEVRLADDHTPQLAISRQYQRMLKNKQSDPVTREFIQKKIQSARWLIESIEQRRSTLLKVAKAIIAHQRNFLDKGPEAIEPLKMQEIADRVGVHVTTVSRAVDDKWVQTPRGIFALKRFFGGGHDGRQRRGSRLGDDQAEAPGNPLQGRQAEPALGRGDRRGTRPVGLSGRSADRHEVPQGAPDSVESAAQGVLKDRRRD